MRVLNLVTTGYASFFRQQVETLEGRGVDCTTVAVRIERGESRDWGWGDAARAYARLAALTLAEARKPYDLVHVNYGLIAPLGLVQPIRPVVLTLWGSDLMGDGLQSVVGRHAAPYCDAVVVPSPAMSSHLSIPHEVIPFGVDTDLFRPIPRAEARQEVGWDLDDPIVLFPYATERPVKDYPRAEAIVDRLSVDADLRAVTGVPHERMPYYMNASDAVLVTSRREAGPMVVKEAAACDVPVFSTDVGFAREVLAPVVNSGVCTSDAEFADRLDAVLRSGERSDGRETLSDISLDVMGDRLLGLYRRVLGA